MLSYLTIVLVYDITVLAYVTIMSVYICMVSVYIVIGLAYVSIASVYFNVFFFLEKVIKVIVPQHPSLSEHAVK